jgi:hypothetical protein
MVDKFFRAPKEKSAKKQMNVQAAGTAGAGAFFFGAAFFRLRYASRRWRFSTLLLCFPINLYLSSQNCFVYGRNMKTWFRRFNIYLALAAVFPAGGCFSAMHEVTHSKKEQTTIRLYLEGARADSGTIGKVMVTRQKIPFMINREPFLTEADVTKAVLIDDPGGDGSYSIQLAFNDHGTLLMDMITTGNKGKHIIVFSQFPIPGQKQPKPPKKKHSDDDDDNDADQPPPAPPPEAPGKPRQSGWLTAVLIRDRNSTGIFRFTPDASHEEGTRIIRGLKNVIAESKRAEKMQL